MSTKIDKALRILDIYVRLCEGKVVSKKAEAQKFDVDQRSIQRDIDEIRKYLGERVVNSPGDNRTVEYSREQKGFIMTGGKGTLMTNSEILAVCKILLESRAFTKLEMEGILSKLIAGCVPEKNIKLVSDLISNEKFHYVALRNSSAIQDKLWEIGEEVKKQNLLEISYRKGGDEGLLSTSVIQPLAVVFSEFYFYLIANIVRKEKNGTYTCAYEYPAVYRIDRIIEYRELGKKFRVDYANRFEEGMFRKRIQFMFQGKLQRIQFKFYGGNAEAVLDRLPTARIVSEQDGVKLIEAEVYGNGILMWLLSQGEKEFIKKNFEIVKGLIRDFFDTSEAHVVDHFKELVKKEYECVGKGNSGSRTLIEKIWQQRLYFEYQNLQDGLFAYDLEFSQPYPKKTVRDKYATNEPDMFAVRFEAGKPVSLVMIEVKSTKSACVGNSGIEKHLCGMLAYSEEEIFMKRRRKDARRMIEQLNYFGLIPNAPHGFKMTELPDDIKVERILLLTNNYSSEAREEDGGARQYFDENKEMVRKFAKMYNCQIVLANSLYTEEKIETEIDKLEA